MHLDSAACLTRAHTLATIVVAVEKWFWLWTRGSLVMSSSPSATEDQLCRGTDACYICRSSKSLRWHGVEVWRGG
ncbi:hypothetical protein TNCV_3558841 [Trichonephila clavipes]|uniref:Uncharacterized protein n=1 Tax=Trichonephila clavipes TaxID=2585209 RepID=A0A8X6WDT5_TRICX|nr:hypothetical protein TNCV_3558841 [Trichonephila clavipes]